MPPSSHHFLGVGGLFPLPPPDGLPVVLGALTGGFVSAIVLILCVCAYYFCVSAIRTLGFEWTLIKPFQ